MLKFVERIFVEAKRLFEPEDVSFGFLLDFSFILTCWQTPPLIHPYETLESSVMAVDEEILLRKLSTNKKGSCDGAHCSTLEAIGHFDVNKARFESLAPDRLTQLCVSSGWLTVFNQSESDRVWIRMRMQSRTMFKSWCFYGPRQNTWYRYREKERLWDRLSYTCID